MAVSGFVTQGAPEAILQALGQRFERDGSPRDLTLLFGGGPGDYGERGLSHLAKVKTMSDGTEICMLKRTIGGHYGQVPKVAQLALQNKVEAWTLPMGSISRMIRAQSTHSPGHITSIGLGTYCDPDNLGGAANEAAKNSPLHPKLVSKIEFNGETCLIYKALPIDVAIIRGTTADSQGNITLEHESLLCDQKITAAAAKNSGGIVIAQVKRIAADGSLKSREIQVPGPFVDCVVVVDEKDHNELHGMSYLTNHSPALTGEIKIPAGEVPPMSLDIRKMIARRAFFEVRPNQVVNLGIGLPEGVASVAAEEKMLNYLTLSTEPGSFGGLPASGHEFGPAYNASSLMEMNQMFDFYDGGGLDLCFLGAAQIAKNGDVNVSRMSSDRLTGPGGFVDISQSTKNVVFMTPLTTKGLRVTAFHDSLSIDQEGSVKKFVNRVFEKTFSGDEAVRRGQKVFYVTERAVFRRTADHDTIELIEVAPGIDVQKDVIDKMEFAPVISPHLRIMDRRIYRDRIMDVTCELFGSLVDRCTYHENGHTMYLNLFGITLNARDDVEWFMASLREIMRPIVQKKGSVDMVINYDGFDISKELESFYLDETAKIENDFYKSVKRYTGHAFKRAKLKREMKIEDWNPNQLFDEFDVDQSGFLTREQLRNGFFEKFEIRLKQNQLDVFGNKIDRVRFVHGITQILSTST